MASDVHAPIVSQPEEPLILVDGADVPVGTASKQACHQLPGQLHRAFSLFVVRSDGAVLLQQRSQGKQLWPGFWANSCCSHPRQGEALLAAVKRRAGQELGLTVEPRLLFTFRYYAAFADKGCEHELCSVWFARCDAEPKVNPNEVAAVSYVDPWTLSKRLVATPEQFSPWLRLEWPVCWYGHGHRWYGTPELA